ncbi:hypothetical protein [Kitasatospora griseola]|uniref:hypothetical protein n=1 Tax=Kitasatospora griseola TaxID=2064 RepID=UPI00381085EA
MRALRTVAAACLAAGLLTACGSSGSDGGAAEAKPSPSASSESGGGQGGALLGAKETLLASAVVMEKAGSAKLTISGRTEGTGEFVWTAPKSFLLNAKSEGEDTKVLFVGDVMYIGADADTAATVGGRTWLKMDPKAAAQGVPGADAPGLASTMELIDPAVQLAVAAPTAIQAGSETVAGQFTRHYRSTVPVDALVEKMQLASELKTEVLAGLKKKGSTISTEFWINAKGELVQQSTNGLSTGSAKILYTGLGTVQPTRAPADSEVFSPADLLKQ